MKHAGAAFYVSGHGFGHATRTSEVIRAFQRLRPECRVFVRTLAPAGLFPAGIECESVSLDSGVVEGADRLTIDTTATMHELRHLLIRAPDIVAAESAFVRANQIGLIVADIPFFAGEIAPELPHVAIGNFTWDWIYEPMTGDRDAELLPSIRAAYNRFHQVLRVVPLCQPDGWEMFPICRDVPLIARRSERSREDVRSQMGAGSRPVVFLGSRAVIPEEALYRAAAANAEYLFFTLSTTSSVAENVRLVRTGPGLTFPDVLNASDVVLSKLGYSIAAECIVAGKRILYPPRLNFREEAVIEREIVKYIPAEKIAAAEFAAGEWREGLRAVMRAPQPDGRVKSDGASVCAQALSGTFDHMHAYLPL